MFDGPPGGLGIPCQHECAPARLGICLKDPHLSPGIHPEIDPELSKPAEAFLKKRGNPGGQIPDGVHNRPRLLFTEFGY